MILFLLLLFIISLYKVKVAPVNTFHKDYLNHKNTVLINGVFVILVYLSHSSAKCALNGVLDAPYLLVKNHLLQLVVVTFLFYSGYGMCESMKRKPNYGSTLMTTRFPKLLLHYDIAILFYLLVQYLLGKVYSVPYILQAFIGWKSVGNSNWYIFVMLLLYVLMSIAYLFTKKKGMVHLTTVLVVGYVLLMKEMNIPTRFYNTVLCFNLGMYYSLYKEHIENIVMNNEKSYWLCGCGCLLMYGVLYHLRDASLIYYILWTFAFMGLVLLFTMKVKLNSRVLKWFGTNIFGVYILQRIPMNVLCQFGLQKNTYLFVVICLVITCGLTVIFNRILQYVDALVFERRRKLG